MFLYNHYSWVLHYISWVLKYYSFTTHSFPLILTTHLASRPRKEASMEAVKRGYMPAGRMGNGTWGFTAPVALPAAPSPSSAGPPGARGLQHKRKHQAQGTQSRAPIASCTSFYGLHGLILDEKSEVRTYHQARSA